jgi:outer membrane protein insertion porin family
LLRTILFIILSIGLLSCSVRNRMNEGEYLVLKNKIKIENASPSLDKASITNSLIGLYRQPPNQKTLWLLKPNVHMWYNNKDKSSRWSRFIMAKIAEPPVIYQDKESERTAKNMRNSMHQRGYFSAKCRYETNFGNKTARITYFLDPGPRQYISKLSYTTQDSALLEYLQKLSAGSLLAVGKPVAADLFNAEKNRITDTLKNNGYAFFVPNNVDFSADSTNGKMEVRVDLLQPTDSTFHKRIYIGKSTVYSAVVAGNNQSLLDTTIYDIKILSGEKDWSVRPHIISEAIKLKPGAVYRQSDFDRTYRNLSSLGVYRLVTIKSVKDTLNPTNLNVGIFVAPNKRVAFGFDLDANHVSGNSATNAGRLLGTSLGANLKNKNVRGIGAQNLINLRGGVDFDIINFKDSPVYSSEIRLSDVLTIPRFEDYMGAWRLANGIKLRRKRIIGPLYDKLKEDGSTQFSLTISYLSLINQFDNASINLSYGYLLNTRKSKSVYRWNHVGLDILRVRSKPAFDTILNANPILKKSLGDQLFTGFIFRDGIYKYLSTPDQTRRSWSATIATEFSGAEVFATNWLYNRAFEDVNFKIDQLNFATFARADADFGFSYPLSTANGLGLFTRLGSSIVTPFGNSTSIPYVKQVLIGGPNSLRAWRSREIGPGGYQEKAQIVSNQYYQAADLRLEMNAELRFNLIAWVKGAIFLDAGNIWTLKNEALRIDRITGIDPGRISSQFYKQIAVGTGFGFRGDFEYLIVRLDFGLKVRNPFPDEAGNHSALNNLTFRKFNLNLAIGYPF